MEEGKKTACTVIAGGGGRCGGPRREGGLFLSVFRVCLPPAVRAVGRQGAVINRGRLPARTTESFGLWRSHLSRPEPESSLRREGGIGVRKKEEVYWRGMEILLLFLKQAVDLLMMSILKSFYEKNSNKSHTRIFHNFIRFRQACFFLH